VTKKYKEDEIEKLKDYMDKHVPLGAIRFENKDFNYDPWVQQELFDGHSAHLYNNESKKPSIIVGRRGSGKSTYINNLANSKDILEIIAQGDTLIKNVANEIQSLAHQMGTNQVEPVSRMWDFVFWALITSKVNSEYSIADDTPVSGLLKKLGIGKKLPTFSIVLHKATSVIKDYVSEKTGLQDFDLIYYWLTNGEHDLMDMKNYVCNLLKEEKKKAIILFDSLEELDINNEHVGDAVKGLMYILGKFNDGSGVVQIRFCIPAERYFEFKKVSAAEKKDFGREHTLQWTSGELLSMVAHRYKIFLKLYPEYQGQNYEKIRSIDIYNRNGALKFFRVIFPENVINNLGKGTKEDPIAYILRHTQLLPRQILDYFNCIISSAVISRGTATEINNDDIVNSISLNEQSVSEEVISSYSFRYPSALEVLEDVVPDLPLIMTWKELKKIFIETARSSIAKGEGGSKPDDKYFKRLLIETGIIGLVLDDQDTNSDSDRYIKAQFEYTVPQKLSISSSQRMAVHPLFSGSLNNANEHIDSKKAIYPYGAHLDDVDVYHSMYAKS
jgi:hypothetical protein